MPKFWWYDAGSSTQTCPFNPLGYLLSVIKNQLYIIYDSSLLAHHMLCLADPGKARGWFTNTIINKSAIEYFTSLPMKMIIPKIMKPLPWLLQFVTILVWGALREFS